jgi:hypothetical protein
LTSTGLRKITVAWIVLSALTIGSWWMSPAHAGDTPVRSLGITLAVIVVGFVKSRLIIRYFMEVSTAPNWLKSATDGWLLVLWGSALAIYLY